MSRITRIIAGSVALGLLSLSAPHAAGQPDTSLWSTSADQMHYKFSDPVFHDKEAYRYKCMFLKSEDTDMHRVCTSEKSRVTGDAQLITRDLNGQLVALSTVVNIQNTEANQIATVIDGTMMSYLLGKVTQPEEMMRRAKQARVKLLTDVEKKGRVLYDRGDATITAYLRNGELHIDIDKPQDTSSDE